MTLGETILTLRKQKKLSQEDVGAILGVSRQAVSKWETDQSLPDTGNLLALADLLEVSVEELTGRGSDGPASPPAPAPPEPEGETPPAPRRRLPVLAVLLAAAALALLLLFSAPHVPSAGSDPEDVSAAGSGGDTPEDEIPSSVQALGDFTLFWFDQGVQKQLTLGQQDSLWDFGMDIATYSVDGPRKTDWPGTFVTTYLCSAPETHPPAFDTFSVTVMSVTEQEDAPDFDSITFLSTTSEAFTTPRGIRVGSREGDLTLAYDDGNLCYHLKEHGSDLLCPHDYYYLYAREDQGWRQELRFYVSNGQVAGIAMEDLLDGAGRDPVDNVSCFPVTEGTADFSRRVDPEQEDCSDASLLVYQAFYALTQDENLSAEEIYRYRRQLFSYLAGMDWTAYGQIACDVGVESPEYGAAVLAAQEALTGWLRQQETLSRDELRWLMEGVQSHPDGCLAEEYSGILCHAFFLYPVEFAALSLGPDMPQPETDTLLSLTAYGADLYPPERAAAAKAVEDAMAAGLLGDGAQALLDALEDPYGQANTP